MDAEGFRDRVRWPGLRTTGPAERAPLLCARSRAVDSYDCFLTLGEADTVSSWLLHIQFCGSVERVVARLDDRAPETACSIRVQVVDRYEEHGRVADEFVRRFWLLRQHARARLVHDFDVAGFHAGKYQLAVVAGDLVLGGEAELVSPEAKARLDFVDDQNGSQVLQTECGLLLSCGEEYQRPASDSVSSLKARRRARLLSTPSAAPGAGAAIARRSTLPT